MSSATIARWKSIPMTRAEGDDSSASKRSRPPSDDEDEDDDISIVSRSPSPVPAGEGNHSRSGTEWYDDHIKGAAREIITVETKIKPTNVGFNLLKKMGWKEGEGLGLTGEGRPDPIPFSLKRDNTGLGKINQDLRVIESTVAQRRELDSERQVKETAEQRKAREELVAQRESIKSEVTTVLRPFYCELCDKQYSNVSQYDEHIRGYAHTHKLRFKEMAANQRPKDTEKRKEKERKREEKELRKLAAAHGVKMPLPTPVAPAVVAPVAPSSSTADPGPKKGGWSTVGATSKVGGGWSTVGSSSATSGGSSAATPTRSWSAVASGTPSTIINPTSSGWSSTSSAPPQPLVSASDKPSSAVNNPFKSGGWTRLATTTTDPLPDTVGSNINPTAPEAPKSNSRWAPVIKTEPMGQSLPSGPSQLKFSSPQPPPDHAPPPPPSHEPPPPPSHPPNASQRPGDSRTDSRGSQAASSWRNTGPQDQRRGWNSESSRPYGSAEGSYDRSRLAYDRGPGRRNNYNDRENDVDMEDHTRDGSDPPPRGRGRYGRSGESGWNGGYQHRANNNRYGGYGR